MTNSKRREIFAGIPGGKPGHGAVTFVLPNLSPDSKRGGIGNMNGRGRPNCLGYEKQKKTDAGDAAARMLLG